MITRFNLEVDWSWGGENSSIGVQGRPALNETFNTTFVANDIKDVEEHVKCLLLTLMHKISKNYMFDCGKLERPLNPRINSIRYYPICESIYTDVDKLGLIGDFERIKKHYTDIAIEVDNERKK